MNHALHHTGISAHQRFGVLLDVVVKRGVFQQGHLDCFGYTAAPFAIWQRVEEVEVVQHGERWSECAQKVLLAEAVDAVLHAHPRVSLREDRRGNADQTDAAMSSGGCITDRVEERAAPNRDDERL